MMMLCRYRSGSATPNGLKLQPKAWRHQHTTYRIPGTPWPLACRIPLLDGPMKVCSRQGQNISIDLLVFVAVPLALSEGGTIISPFLHRQTAYPPKSLGYWLKDTNTVHCLFHMQWQRSRYDMED
ncbi:hypothetical protein PoB_003095000 [Plakobranchus ocellatus]|uniref:Uncharacterized protein n=1 Tax=Plakobranchus ocellatus TaxID=259542 RepID=A0AAV4AAL5_9GAST|nr:hypothetical protein PoB_003095000 [Plakobranchus ocellatus]